MHISQSEVPAKILAISDQGQAHLNRMIEATRAHITEGCDIDFCIAPEAMLDVATSPAGANAALLLIAIRRLATIDTPEGRSGR